MRAISSGSRRRRSTKSPGQKGTDVTATRTAQYGQKYTFIRSRANENGTGQKLHSLEGMSERSDALRRRAEECNAAAARVRDSDVIALEARDKGMLGITLRYPYEVRKQSEYFDEIEDEKVSKEMMDLALHSLTPNAATSNPENLGSIRRCFARADRNEGQRREDRAAEAACPIERRQSDGCAAGERRS